ncbi:cupin domain-containing protein [uncultured Roseovarius sp.]|uniref:cupin domain-containing protein n=1 Tax=uncultured Roseovarius sp. TaxID=293344 RepID=UPI0026075D23|nr:cupin domain-containing protein [uncultured Roseovarius sp.]
MNKVNLAEKLALFDTHWDPKVVASYNGNDVMVVKFQGEFPFHKHDDTDDFFLILDGAVTLDQEGGASVTMGPGELCVVPKGIVHRPRAETEAKVLLIEPAGEPNTGDSGMPAAAKQHI